MAWLSPENWKLVQDSVPICCVDVLPIHQQGAVVTRVGLILRDTPHQGRRWCLVGGRLLRDEPLIDAARRQLHETLGVDAQNDVNICTAIAYVAQYHVSRREGALHDPRQHAIGLTLIAEVRGAVRPGGEALDFQWFDVGAWPAPEKWGFDQDRVARAALANWSNHKGTEL